MIIKGNGDNESEDTTNRGFPKWEDVGEVQMRRVRGSKAMNGQQKVNHEKFLSLRIGRCIRRPCFAIGFLILRKVSRGTRAKFLGLNRLACKYWVKA